MNQTLATVIDSSPLAIITLDNEQKVTSWNAAAERLFGWSASEAMGNRPPMIPEWRQQTFDSNSQKLAAGQRITAMEVPGVRRDGTLTDVALWAAPLTDDFDKVIGNVRIYADMSDRHRAEQEIRRLNENLERRVKERTSRLEEVNEELQAFSYTVSHDLRIPLRSLQAIARDLVENHATGLDEEGKTDALRVVGAAARMESQIEELLEFSRVSRDQLQLEPVSLVLIFHELTGRLERDEMLKDAEVTVTEPLGWVLAHRLTLQQVVLNLLVNALTFIRPGVRPAINIRADQRDGTVSLCIEDNGIGIDAADRERVFHVFERLPAAESFPGIGVGLTVARRGVERMGGKISVTATRDHGTTFIIELPASKKAGAK